MTVIQLMIHSANLLNQLVLKIGLGLTYKSASFLVERLGEGMIGAFENSLDSLLEA